MEDLKFDFIDKVKEQRDKRMQDYMDMAAREEEAKREWLALKQQFEQTLIKGIHDKQDVTKELEQLNEEIEKAEKTYKLRQREREVYRRIKQEEAITTDDVLREWNEVYYPKVKEERLGPILKRMLRAKRDYVQAVLEYRGLVREIDDEINSVCNIVGDSIRYRLSKVSFNFRQEREKYQLTAADLSELERGEMPRSLQYVDPKEYE
jgi:Glu-tRNA(Gln) amidotransferase subunit E-like FAD-binding protein